MASVQGTAMVGAPINVSGLLYNKTKVQTPIFNMIGSATTNSRRFITGATYDLGYPASAHAGITETASLTAPDPHYWERTNSENVTQIFQEAVAVSYRKTSNAGDLSHYQVSSGTWSLGAGQPANVGNTNNVPNELAFQIANTMDKIKLDLEYTLINGTFQDSLGNPGTADKTRGLVSAISTNVQAAGGSELSYDLIYTCAETIAKSGSPYGLESYIWILSYTQFKQLQKIVADEGLRIVKNDDAGTNLTSVVTPFGIMRFMPHRFMPNGTAVLMCVPAMRNVFQPVPGKGNFFYEPLAKTGAAEKGQIYGQWGLDYGPEFLHLKVTGLATTTSDFTAPKVYISNFPTTQDVKVVNTAASPVNANITNTDEAPVKTKEVTV